MKHFDIISVFPNILDSYFNESLLKKARQKGLLEIKIHNLRDFSADKHRRARPTERKWSFGRVDDSPYGGGPGMVIKAEPVLKAVASVKRQVSSVKKKRVILFSLRGKKFDQAVAHRLAKYDQLIFICGRYEGVDERVAEHIADEEISVGDFILSGGELPAAIVVEAVARLIPGFLGKYGSLEELKGSYPVYTKPEVIKSKILPAGRHGKNQKSKFWKVPKILLSGDHKKIEAWRESHS